MPLSVNVGLSRKASRNFQSTGVSINVTAELDQSLLARPDELQQEIGNLYAQAQQALEQQAGRAPRNDTRQSRPYPSRNGAPSNRNGGNGNGNGHHGGMTESQRKAIFAIARRANIDPAHESDQIVGVALDDLSVRQASDLIDHLKCFTSADRGR